MKRLTILTIALALPVLAACDPAPLSPINLDSGGSSFPVKPPCVDDVYLLDWFETETTCDLIVPQILAKRMADLTTESRDKCHRSGGRVMVDNAGGTAYCLDMDY